MANIKFSQFTEKTTLGTIDFLVGYTGAENVQISPTNLLSTFVSGSGTAGQVAYFDPSNNLAGENDFFWDYTNNRLGVGTITPSAKLHVVASDAQQLYLSRTGAISGTYRLAVAGLTNNFYITDISQGQNRFMINASGNIGIGTDSPASKLDVIGGVTAQGTLVATGISQLGSGGSNVYLTSSSAGSVGIGTSSPSYKLDVYGDAVGGVVRVKNVLNGRDTLRSENAAGTRTLNFGNDGSGHGLFIIRDSSGGVRNYITGSGNSYFNGGNVGIGTTSPSEKLEVNGNIKLSGNGTGNDSYAINFKNTACAIARDSNDLELHAYDNMVFGVSNTSYPTSTERMRITSAGNVGIGTSSPGSKLQVNGTSTFLGSGAASLKWGNASQIGTLTFDTNSDPVIRAESGKSLKFDTNGANNALTLNTSQDATFAGTLTVEGADAITIPDYILHAGDDSKFGFPSNDNFKIRLAGSDLFTMNTTTATFAGDITVSTAGATLNLLSETNGNSTINFADPADNNVGQIIYRHNGNSMAFDTNDVERMRIDSSGNVGIGSTSPTSKLTVAVGDIETSGVGYGIILKSPDGTRYRVTVANGGTLSVSAV